MDPCWGCKSGDVETRECFIDGCGEVPLCQKRATEENAGRRFGMTSALLSNGAVVLYRTGTMPRLSILTGLHGEERSGPLFIRNKLREWADGHLMPPCTLMIVPIDNDVGWNKGSRLWRKGALTNNFRADFQKEDGSFPPALELRKHYEVFRPDLHWDIHEDCTEEKPYVWSYRPEPASTKALAKHFGCKIRPWKKNDGASEAVLKLELGTKWSVTTEAPTVEMSLDSKLEWLERAYQFIVKCLTPDLRREPLRLI